jgi:NADH-quinone oxidoreductase subunit J
VLFLFVVMMLDIDFAELRAGFVRNAPLGLVLAVVLFVELFVGILVRSAGDLHIGKAATVGATPAGLSNTAAIGGLLYTRYLFEFEAAGMILLVAMIGAIVLTHRHRGDTRGQNVSKQVARRPQDATVNLKPEVGKGVTL